MVGNTWKAEIWLTILNIFRPYNGIDVLKLLFLEELHEKTSVVPYVHNLRCESIRRNVEAFCEARIHLIFVIYISLKRA